MILSQLHQENSAAEEVDSKPNNIGGPGGIQLKD